jgi:hypothetical protein
MLKHKEKTIMAENIQRPDSLSHHDSDDVSDRSGDVSPIDHMDIGAEYLWGQRDNKNGDVGTARRIQVSTKYLF